MSQSKKDKARNHELMYKYFELNLSKPMDSQIAKTILLDNECSEIQSENNFSFINNIKSVVGKFLKENELNYKDNSDFKGSPECDCNYDYDYDYDCECSLNEFVMPAFKNMTIEFGVYIESNSVVDNALKEFTSEEQNRLLNCNLMAVIRLILYKGLAYLAFDLNFHDVSCWHHEAAVLMYGGSIVGESLSPSEYVEESEVIARNYKMIGAKGGSQKALNYRKPQQKALIYHDKYLSEKNEKGKYVYSNDKAAREIISYFERKSEHLGYTERSLSNIVSKHRNRQTKD